MSVECECAGSSSVSARVSAEGQLGISTLDCRRVAFRFYKVAMSFAAMISVAMIRHYVVKGLDDTTLK